MAKMRVIITNRSMFDLDRAVGRFVTDGVEIETVKVDHPNRRLVITATDGDRATVLESLRSVYTDSEITGYWTV